MSTTGWIILAVVIVVVLLIALAVWRSMQRKKHAAQAEELRSEARKHAADLGPSRQEAREAQLRAEAAQLAAERAQRDADAASTTLAQQEAVREDRIREADRLDPSVNHKASDYQPVDPDMTGDDTSASGETTGGMRAADTSTDRDYHPTTGGGAHRAQD